MRDDLDHIFGDEEPTDGASRSRDSTPAREGTSNPDEDASKTGTPNPGGTAELVALAAHDANDLLRFVESAMTHEEAEAFLEAVRVRDPESARQLLQMRADQRLLRTAVDLPSVDLDLLGPVRAQLARSELVQVQAEIGGEASAPTAFMARSVAGRARLRRRQRRRNVVLAGFAGVVTAVVVARLLSTPGGSSESSGPGEPLAIEAVEASPAVLAEFGLVVPVSDLARAETAMAIVAVDHAAVLVRNRAASDSGSIPAQSEPIVGAPGDSIPDAMRADLGRRGFSHAIVVDRRDASKVLARIGGVADPSEEGRTSARLVPADTDDPVAALGLDAWSSWSSRDGAASTLVDADGRLVVPIAAVPSPRRD